MTKQEAIQRAYGKHWKDVKDHVNEDGWLDKIVFEETSLNYSDMNIAFRHIDNKYCLPLSLSGIDTNNGWTKIESENDLPKEEGQYFVYNELDGFIQLFTGNLKNAVHIVYGTPLYSHYQPIQKPKPPIY